MDFYRLGVTPWEDSQLLYHALPRLHRAGVLLLTPVQPCISIGYHQDTEREVDLAGAEGKGIPVFRRESGGGAHYFDENRILYQIVLYDDHPLYRENWENLFRILLEPAREACLTLGVPAEFRPVNTVWVLGRRIAGGHLGAVNGAKIFEGYINLDLDISAIARLLDAATDMLQSERRMRHEASATSLRLELGAGLASTQVCAVLEHHLGALLGPLAEQQVDADLRKAVNELRVRLLSRMWLYSRGQRWHIRGGRFRTGILPQQTCYDAPGGQICAAVRIDEDFDKIVSASFSGNFFIYPVEGLHWLENALENAYVSDAKAAIKRVYTSLNLETPGIKPEDWYNAMGI